MVFPAECRKIVKWKGGIAIFCHLKEGWMEGTGLRMDIRLESRGVDDISRA